MWIFLNRSMLSIVQKKDQPAGTLTVRARIEGDIEAVFPRAKVITVAGSDYAFRAIISRKKIAQALAEEVLRLDYDNFKDSVVEVDREMAYANVWYEMLKFQMAAAGEPGEFDEPEVIYEPSTAAMDHQMIPPADKVLRQPVVPSIGEVVADAWKGGSGATLVAPAVGPTGKG